MSAASREKPRGHTRPGRLSTRVTAEEAALVKRLADSAGVTPSEWCRLAIVQTAVFGPDMRIVLAEVVGTRQLLLGLVAALLPGNEDILKREAAAADIRKFAIADGRIRAAREQGL